MHQIKNLTSGQLGWSTTIIKRHSKAVTLDHALGASELDIHSNLGLTYIAILQKADIWSETMLLKFKMAAILENLLKVITLSNIKQHVQCETKIFQNQFTKLSY